MMENSSMIKKRQVPLLITNIVIILSFASYYIASKNYEFLLYVGIIVFLFCVILLTNRKVDYSNNVLWGLTLWGLMHMAGGSIKVNGDVLYALILIPLSSQYGIFRYDQLVHMIGFGVATVVMYQLIRPKLKDGIRRWTALSVVIVMAGLGVGAFNEIVEFIATLIDPDNGVGGYINTSLDLISNLIGAMVAVAVIRLKEKKISGKAK